MGLCVADLVEERRVKLGLELLVAIALNDLRYFLLPPDVRRVVQVTFQSLPSAQVDDRLADEETCRAGGQKRAISGGRAV